MGRRWKGQQIYSAYQKFVHNPRTSAQRIIRARFAQIVSLATAFLPALKMSLAGLAKQRGCTESNVFMDMNWDFVTAATPDAVTVDFARLQVSAGKLPQLSFGTPSFEEECNVAVTFATDVADYESELDLVYLFAYQPDTGVGVLSDAVARTVGAISLDVPSVWSGMKVHLYGFVVGNGDNTKDKVSATTYVGTGNIA